VEELEGFMEEQIKAAGIDCVGKELIGNMYELNPQILKERIFGVKAETKDVGVKAVSRPPALCPGCPHRGFFYTVGKNKNYIVTGGKCSSTNIEGVFAAGDCTDPRYRQAIIAAGSGARAALDVEKYLEHNAAKF